MTPPPRTWAGIAKRGLRNLLIAAGVLRGQVTAQPTQWLDMPDGDCFTFAEDGGLIEFLVDLGDAVAKGQPVARIFPVTRTGVAPVTVSAGRDGLLLARHFPGLVKPGHCVAVIGVEVEE